MEPSALKITIFSIIAYFKIVPIIESKPLSQLRSNALDWTDYNSFEPQGPGTYGFGYDIEDPENDNIQFRDEERFPNGTVKGSYGYLRPDGMVHMVHYIADKAGYRATVESYPRGQLKPFSNLNFIPERSTTSSALTATLQSKAEYKKQIVHEQRIRPVDVTLPVLISFPKVKNTNNSIYKNEKYQNAARI